jgi:hypothetical protein
VPAPLAGAYISLWSVIASFGLGLAALNPMWSIGGALATHAVLAIWGAREPHLATLFIAHSLCAYRARRAGAAVAAMHILITDSTGFIGGGLAAR